MRVSGSTHGFEPAWRHRAQNADIESDTKPTAATATGLANRRAEAVPVENQYLNAVLGPGKPRPDDEDEEERRKRIDVRV
jgi:hypothetical protein